MRRFRHCAGCYHVPTRSSSPSTGRRRAASSRLGAAARWRIAAPASAPRVRPAPVSPARHSAEPMPTGSALTRPRRPTDDSTQGDSTGMARHDGARPTAAIRGAWNGAANGRASRSRVPNVQVRGFCPRNARDDQRQRRARRPNVTKGGSERIGPSRSFSRWLPRRLETPRSSAQRPRGSSVAVTSAHSGGRRLLRPLRPGLRHTAGNSCRVLGNARHGRKHVRPWLRQVIQTLARAHAQRPLPQPGGHAHAVDFRALARAP